jgi:hypothetical protein
MMRLQSLAVTVALLPVLWACGVSSSIGSLEPFRVENGQFVEGSLPAGDADDEDLPKAASPVASTLALRERLAGVSFTGAVSDTALSIGLQFDGLGSGYWLIPTGSRDSLDPRSLIYSFTADFQAALPAGKHSLLVVGFNKDGEPGPATRTDLCIQSLRPDNGNACFPAIAPPAIVLSLEWDVPSDLDVLVVAPDGRVVSAKQPTLPDLDPSYPPIARLVADGNADCHFDGRQREDVVFDELPPPGNYKIYTSLARACGEESTRYTASFTTRVSKEEETFGVRTRQLGGGILTRAQVNLSGGLGTFVAEVQVK